uniref:Uncharacterized protein n=1 Tax=Brassica oleracea var. oleracea TaxID=109376 RepID=A0A0D3C7P1_BRAOL
MWGSTTGTGPMSFTSTSVTYSLTFLCGILFGFFAFRRLFRSNPFVRSNTFRIVRLSTFVVETPTTTSVGLVSPSRIFYRRSIHFGKCLGSRRSGIMVFD